MAIKKIRTEIVDGVTLVLTSYEYTERVLDVQLTTEQLNCSDTLDYTDYRSVKVTRALVYHGHQAPVADRFSWIDCTNLFVWRGQSQLTPEVDVVWTDEMRADHVAWTAHWDAVKSAEIAMRRAKSELIAKTQREIAERAERNRPVLGKQMVVVRGRKVPHGTKGTVSYIHSNGSVLLKAHSEWRNRKADGVWVAAQYLEAV